jgi:uncharacterized protein YegP (UPF0339 family)
MSEFTLGYWDAVKGIPVLTHPERIVVAIMDIPKLTFEVYQSGGQWYWRLKADNGKIVADGSEGYTSKQGCLDGLALVKKGAEYAEIKFK